MQRPPAIECQPTDNSSHFWILLFQTSIRHNPIKIGLYIQVKLKLSTVAFILRQDPFVILSSFVLIRGVRDLSHSKQTSSCTTKTLYSNSAIINYDNLEELRYDRPQLLGASLKLAVSSHFKVGLKSCGGTHHDLVIFYLACCCQTLTIIEC